MSSKSVLNRFVNLRKQNKKAFAVLIDPDNTDMNQIIETAQLCNEAKVDFVFMGGSLMLSNHLDECIKTFKSKSSIPVILFPGSPSQVSKEADALLYLALISGRNPELLIGAHVVSAPKIKASGLEIISTGYIIVDGGKPTAVSYMSNSAPIPYDKDDIAVCTAIAGEFLGKNVLYMDAGSGAINPVSENMIQKVSNQISIPLIVGGGISSPEKAIANCQAGADIIVVGNALEKDNQLIKILAEAIHSC
jgi:putative glycerol-1-phosphate prenyltransferase